MSAQRNKRSRDSSQSPPKQSDPLDAQTLHSLKEWLKSDAAKAMVSVCALVQAKSQRLCSMVRERGGSLETHSSLITFHVLKTLNMFKREIHGINSRDGNYSYEIYSFERLFGLDEPESLQEAISTCETWLKEWIYVANQLRAFRQQVQEAGVHLPETSVILNANDLMIDMLRSLKFQRLKELVPDLPCNEPGVMLVEDDEEACTDGEDDEEEEDDEDEEDDDFIATSEDEAM